MSRSTLLRGGLLVLCAFAIACMALKSLRAQAFTVIHNFSSGADGGGPETGTLDPAGNFYGTAGGGTHQQNCQYGCGIVFKLSLKNGAWTLSTLYNFSGSNDGEVPNDGVVFGPDGSLYGNLRTTGGWGNGVLWEITL